MRQMAFFTLCIQKKLPPVNHKEGSFIIIAHSSESNSHQSSVPIHTHHPCWRGLHLWWRPYERSSGLLTVFFSSSYARTSYALTEDGVWGTKGMQCIERIHCCEPIEKRALLVYTVKLSGGQFQKSIVFLRHQDSVFRTLWFLLW